MSYSNTTIRENIALADPGMQMEAVMAAAQLAGAHGFILELPEGYDTIVGERGASLSGGQRQRVAIARALATRPRILIFDEATSALDYESERILQQHLRRICQGRTVFIIAHRLSAVRDVNRIITLEHGRIVEQGTHEDLLRTGESAHMMVDGQEQAVAPGMAVTAEIKTGRRSVISYLLSPLQRYAHEGIRER